MCCESLFVFLVVCTDFAAFRCREIATSYDSLEPNQNHVQVAAGHGNLLAQVLARAAHRRHRRLALSLQLSTWRMLNYLEKAGSSWKVDIVLGWTSTIPKGKTPYRRWILQCTHHNGCTRKRSTAITGVHGDVEPLAYLLAWNRHGFDVIPEQHQARYFPITPEEVAREVVLLGNKARPVLDLL